MIQLDDIIREVKSKLPGTRFQHSWQVAILARELAAKNNICPQQAFLAGLLHDYGRFLDNHQLLEQARNAGLAIHTVDEKLPMLLHGPVGAILAEKDFGIKEPQVLAAITYHTTGRADMSPLEMLIYLVDMIEPGRSFPDVDQLRTIVGKASSLPDAVEICLSQSLIFNIKKKTLIHPLSIDALNCLRSRAYDIV